MNEHNVMVIKPNGVAWAVRFLDTDGAWGRLLSLKGYEDTNQSRQKLRQEGWVIKDIEAEPR